MFYFQFGEELLTACVVAFDQQTMKNKGDAAWKGAREIVLKNRLLREKFLERAQSFQSDTLTENDKEAAFNMLVKNFVMVVLTWSMLLFIMNATLGDARSKQEPERGNASRKVESCHKGI